MAYTSLLLKFLFPYAFWVAALWYLAWRVLVLKRKYNLLKREHVTSVLGNEHVAELNETLARQLREANSRIRELEREVAHWSAVATPLIEEKKRRLDEKESLRVAEEEYCRDSALHEAQRLSIMMGTRPDEIPSVFAKTKGDLRGRLESIYREEKPEKPVVPVVKEDSSEFLEELEKA